MTAMTFERAEPTEEFDTVPPLDNIEYPCRVCGREAGPYSGHGRKPVLCDDHKKSKSAGSSPRMSSKTTDLAVQAAKTLAGVNSMMAMGIAAMGFFRSAGALFERNDDFEKAAYTALLTDPDLCRQILKVGATSSKLSLGMAYVSLGMGIAPTVAEEYKEKKEARRVRMEAAE